MGEVEALADGKEVVISDLFPVNTECSIKENTASAEIKGYNLKTTIEGNGIIKIKKNSTSTFKVTNTYAKKDIITGNDGFIEFEEDTQPGMNGSAKGDLTFEEDTQVPGSTCRSRDSRSAEASTSGN